MQMHKAWKNASYPPIHITMTMFSSNNEIWQFVVSLLTLELKYIFNGSFLL